MLNKCLLTDFNQKIFNGRGINNVEKTSIDSEEGEFLFFFHGKKETFLLSLIK